MKDMWSDAQYDAGKTIDGSNQQMDSVEKSVLIAQPEMSYGNAYMHINESLCRILFNDAWLQYELRKANRCRTERALPTRLTHGNLYSKIDYEHRKTA